MKKNIINVALMLLSFATILSFTACHEEDEKVARKPLRRPRPRELRAVSSCMAWRAIPCPLSKRKRRLDSLEAAQGA